MGLCHLLMKKMWSRPFFTDFRSGLFIWSVQPANTPKCMSGQSERTPKKYLAKLSGPMDTWGHKSLARGTQAPGLAIKPNKCGCAHMQQIRPEKSRVSCRGT